MLRKFLSKALCWITGTPGVPVFLFLLAALAYGMALAWAGFYWDDFHFIWIAHQYGPAGLSRYFATNRPYWGLLFQGIIPLLGSTPWRWQLFAIFWRWTSAVAFWGVVRLAWPRLAAPAVWAAIFALLFPAFSQQYVSVVYSGFFIVMTAFLVSLVCSLLAVRRPQLKLPLTILGLALSLANLVMMEYFFLLELLRPILIWAALGGTGAASPSRRERLKRTGLAWLPYGILFLCAGLWRAFFFRFQTQNYQPLLLQQLRAHPLQALVELISTALWQIWITGAAAWGQVFRPPSAELGARSLALYWQIIAAAGLLAVLFLAARALFQPPEETNRRAALGILAAGLAAMLLAGVPFWVISVPINLLFPTDRFNLPFIVGAPLALAGLLRLLPARRWANLLLAGLVGITAAFAAGNQFQVLNSYRQDWNVQKNLFWQMSWRIPALEPGTAVLAHELPVIHYTDNSLTAPLNWTYAPDNHSGPMPYAFYYPTLRMGTAIPAMKEGLLIDDDFLTARFEGSTDRMVAIYYNPPACLRVLDPLVEADNWMVPVQIRAVLKLASTRPILPGPENHPPGQVFGAEPAHGWCYFFEKADLSRQQKDWQQVAVLGDLAFDQADYPNDPAERLPFIEGYAHTGRWDRAMDLSRETRQVTPVMGPVLCSLWQRISDDAPPGAEKDQAVQTAKQEFGCHS